MVLKRYDMLDTTFIMHRKQNIAYKKTLTYNKRKFSLVMMEKRHLLLFLVIAVSFFMVNYYYQYQNQEQLREWNLKQKDRKINKIKQLEADIAKRTAKSSTLPLMNIYADGKAPNFLVQVLLMRITSWL